MDMKKSEEDWWHQPDDCDLWHDNIKHRWVFNKLEVAVRCGYTAGPVPVLPPVAGYYCLRPIYNLIGMGIGAKRVYLDTVDNDVIYKDSYPSSFWCEWFDGPHYSIDYEWKRGKWKPVFATQGFNTPENIVQFERWIKIDPPDIQLYGFIDDLKDNKVLNIEFKGDKVLEIHLRHGNINGDWYGLDAKEIIPIWQNTPETVKTNYQAQGYKFISRPADTLGWVEIERIGFYYR